VTRAQFVYGTETSRCISFDGSAVALQFRVKVGSADRRIFLLALPLKSLFEQLKHPLDKRPRWANSFGHKITSIIFVMNERQIRNSE
jgi:hypothetical protein